MKILHSFVRCVSHAFVDDARPNRRTTLRDLHAFGHLGIFRRDSLLRLWEPLREQPARTEESSG